MNTLIIYSIIPDEIVYFIVPDDKMNPAWIPFLNQASGCTVNIDDRNDGLDWMMQATSFKPEFCQQDVFPEYHCCLAPFKVEYIKGEALQGPFSKVYAFGFYL